MPEGKKQTVRRQLLRAGFEEKPGKGSHRKYKHPDGRYTQIPFGGKPNIKPGLMSKIAKESGLNIAYLTGAE